MDKNSTDAVQEGPSKPVLRSTRSRELRSQKSLDGKKTEVTRSKVTRQAKIKAPEPAKEEAMDISISEEEDESVLQRRSAELVRKIAEIEEREMEDEHHVGTYVNTCYQYLRSQEHQMALKPRYLDGQSEVSPKVSK